MCGMKQQRGRQYLVVLLAGVALLATRPAAAQGIAAGRDVDTQRDSQTRLLLGQILKLEGFVQETTQLFTDGSGQGLSLSDVDGLNDFSVDGGQTVIGLEAEKLWRYVTLHVQVTALNPKVRSVARRDYYLDVGDVTFNGVTFDSMLIPEGTAFSASLSGVIFGLDVLATPVSIRLGEKTVFVPSVGLGVFGLYGSYDIDAGPARGIVTYGGESASYVIAGHADGTVGAGIPELAFGGELRFGDPDAVHGELAVYAGLLALSGGASYFTTTDNRDEDVEIDHARYRVRGGINIPLESGRMLTFGAQFEHVQSDVTLTHYDTSDSGSRTRVEGAVDFRMQVVSAYAGLAF